MSFFIRNHSFFSCITVFVWSVAIFPITDSGNITWYEPPPFETITDPAIVSSTKKNLTEGLLNQELSCNFSLTAGLNILTVSMKFGSKSAVTYAHAQEKLSVQSGFINQLNASWVPNKLTLNLFNAMEGEYRCEVISVGEQVETWARKIQVSLLVQSNITKISENQTVIERENVTLECSADGNPPPTTTWTRLADNSVVPKELIDVKREDAGKYRCTAANDVGIPATGTISIDVHYEPDHVSLNISTNKVCAGTTVTFTCLGGAANPPVRNYTLYKTGSKLIYISSNQVGVFNQTLDKEGLYHYICEASNYVGNKSSSNRSVEVQVYGSVKIAKGTVLVPEGANVTVHCNFSGFHSQHVSWINASNYIVETGSNLMFPNISRRHAGEYNCSASNVCRVDSKRVYINVQYPAEATGTGQNYTLDKRRSVRFKCPVAGNPVPNITWYNGSIVPVSFEKELESRDSGCYTCVADNSLGKSINITQCLTITKGTSSTATPSTTHTRNIQARMRLGANYEKEYQDLKSVRSKRFVGDFVQEMDKIYKNFSEYKRTEVTRLSPGSVIVYFILYFSTAVTSGKGLEILRDAISRNDTFGHYRAKDLVLLSEESTTYTTLGSAKPTVSAGPPWAIIGAVAGGVVSLVLLVGVLTWWVHKQRKCRKDSKIHDSDLGRHDYEGGCSQVHGAYAQSGPPAANGTDGAAEQETEVGAAIPTYAVVDKSNKSKKQADEKPPEYTVVNKSKKKGKEGASAIPTYAAVDKSKKKTSREEVTPVYAEVDKSKKKKKKFDDKNFHETLDEAKKEKKPGELLYADLGDFQNPVMPTVSISPQPLPAIKKADPYERTDYADITQFLKGNATLSPSDSNGDKEMKPKRPSKKKIQGNDKETPI